MINGFSRGVPMRRVAITMFSAGALILTLTGGSLQEEAGRGHPRGEVDCRAGCQGSVTGCREYTRSATFVADPGYYLDVSSIRVVSQRNASDSPGLAHEPTWAFRDSYASGGRIRRITVVPDVNTCVGVSPHTQGVTFYTLEILQAPG